MQHRTVTPIATHALRFAKGESVLSGIAEFCADSGIRWASLSAIGAVQEAEFGFYDLAAKRYDFTKLQEVMELTSLIGNVAEVDGVPFVHAHATFTRADGTAVGGHLKECVVGGTCELFLTQYDGYVAREFDEEVGLKLWEL